jgi:hypothetical protein
MGMKVVLSLAFVLACAFTLDAQITAILSRLPDGSDEVRIRNESAQNVWAFVVTVRQVPLSTDAANAPFVVYSDPLVDSSAKPLRAGEERVVMRIRRVAPGRLNAFGKRAAGRAVHVLDMPIFTAGVFADGTTTGDRALLTRLMFRRSSMLLALETALETLLDAGRHNIPRDQLIDHFRNLADSLNRWYLSAGQQVGRGLYQSIVEKLEGLPEGQLGSPFPPSAFIAQETAMLNRQRVTLLESQPSLADAAFVGK